MLDHPQAATNPLPALRHKLLATPPTLSAIFQTGGRILSGTTDPTHNSTAIPADMPIQRVAVLGSVTTDYLARAIACGILIEGTAARVYQAPFGAYIQEILDPASPLHSFAPDLAVIAPDWRDLIADLPIGAATAEVDAALDAKAGLFATLWDRLGATGVKIIQHTLAPPHRTLLRHRRAPCAGRAHQSSAPAE